MGDKDLKPVEWSSFRPLPVIGCDEAGRGCLAGPVVAAAVIFRSSTTEIFRDSKTLTESRREELFEVIQAEHAWAVGFASAQEIDQINILRASLLAMKRAVDGLKVSGGHILVDGKFCIPDMKAFKQTALIKGDSRASVIAAASIVAKVTRDRFMKTLAEEYPRYGFEIHKGYGTVRHREALATFGPTAEHRRSFNWGEIREESL